MYLFSIIIPHKDTPELLMRSIASIPDRSDIQTIVVDDNSKDSNDYLQRYPILNSPNIVWVADHSNKGAGHVRNIGLKYAKGDWILFADADDCFEPGISDIFNRLEQEEADLVYFKIVSRDSDTLIINKNSEYYNSILEKKNPLEFELRYHLQTPWMKAIRRSLLFDNNITFEEVQFGNDTRFSALVGYYANKPAVIPIVGYCWMQREGSLWNQKSNNWYQTRSEVCMRLAAFFFSHKETEVSQFFAEAAKSYLSGMNNLSICQILKIWSNYGMSVGDYSVFYRQIPYHIMSVIKRLCK